MYGNTYIDTIKVNIFVWVDYEARNELNRIATVSIKLSPIIAPTFTSSA